VRHERNRIAIYLHMLAFSNKILTDVLVVGEACAGQTAALAASEEG
jgi:hypothetical protein